MHSLNPHPTEPATLAQLFEFMPQLGWAARPDGWIYYYNRNWYDYTGTTPADMEGWGWQSVHNPELLPAVLERWGRSIRDGVPFEMPFQLRRHDGVFRWFLTRVNPIHADDGTVCGWVGINTDIEEQKRAEDDAASANRAKDEFLALLGHELRNPLAPILTAVQLMKLRGAVPSPRELLILERQSRHMVTLVDDLLDVSRVTRGKITLRRQPLEIGPVLAKAIETASPLLEQRQHRLQVDVPATGLVVDADDVRLAQAFANLLTNAARYTPESGDISVSARRRDATVTVTVRDTGAGIDAALLPHIFDLFVQGRRDVDRREGGLGIGLTLVRSFVELHGGRVEARSDGAGLGSEFIIHLPAAPLPDAVPAPQADSTTNDAVQSGLRRRILIVDDNADAVELLAAYLTTAGHDVRSAHGAADAIELARSFQPDIALLDIGLPVLDGYALAERLRSVLSNRWPTFIAITGYGQAADRARSQEAGFYDHLVKPVTPDVVLATIEDAARRRRLDDARDADA